MGHVKLNKSAVTKCKNKDSSIDFANAWKEVTITYRFAQLYFTEYGL
jgi:hypothetical protein